MSKATPLNQLPQLPSQMDATVADPAEQDVLSEVMKTTGEYMLPPRFAADPPQQRVRFAEPPSQRFAYPADALRQGGLTPESIMSAFDTADVKTFAIAAVLFAVASNPRVVALISARVPMLSGDLPNLAVRAALFAAVLVVAVKALKRA